jgi:hypothetical protein
MNDKQCRTAWQNGLLEADFLAPFNAAGADLNVPNGDAASNIEALEADFEVAASHASWMSHFFDPDTGKNYLGFANSSELPTGLGQTANRAIKPQVEVNGPVPVEGKGSALHRLARARNLLAGVDVSADHPREPTDRRSRGCYELGLALHYFTDLAQPMHSANFAATNRPRLLHSHWETYAMAVQAKFVRSDWSAGPEGEPADVAQSTAVAAKAHWIRADKSPGPLFKAVLDAYGQGGTFDDAGNVTADRHCRSAMLELAVADFVSIDLPKCWEKNPAVLKETGAVLGEAQEATARFLGSLKLPPHTVVE